MRLTFFGAVGEVTGSNYLLENERKYLIDCGIFQGKSENENSNPFPFDPSEISAVLLTHAHLDHSGRIPKLVKDGFKGKIYAVLPTIELCEVLWLDTVKIMKEEVERINRKNQRSGKPLIEPLYTEKEIEIAMKLFEPVPYDEIIDLKDIKVRFRDSAHILGSSSLEIWGDNIKIVFSGDLGQWENVMEGTPALIEQGDYVIIESTYGNRLHKSLEETRKEFKEVVEKVIKEKGKILIPSFVVDRAQRIIYELMLLEREGIIPKDFPIFFDSPMGKKITEIYKKYTNLLSPDLQKYFLESEDPFSLQNLSYVSSVEESKSINAIESGIIIAGSGMCTGGRILHHIKHNIWKENTHVIFVGYQAQGTLGRRLIDGVKKIHVMGEELTVNAKIHTINGFSAHGDQKDLLAWADSFQTNPMFIITHGEPESARTLSLLLKTKGYESLIPLMGQSIDLTRREIYPVKEIVKHEWQEIIEELENQINLIKNKLLFAPSDETLDILKASLILLKNIKEIKND
ncbi:MAG: MBL fold metallo-hydrolase [Dictyoglomus sp.]|nr:MBL fold metallo-hydrolase [Dictyoglomus sp.]MCX7942297.1 MBL fold metallo-hydrolase [Dictyoglomaceae bacterium]MDW8187873.1 MBL fold metallo-hydrolase [Dictyoglomus sp.]